jgi:ceramide glucosyltransferase
MGVHLPILTMVSQFFLAVAILGCVYQLIAAYAVIRLATRTRPRAVDRPPVTLLKPLCGDEAGLFENLSSFCRIDYPMVQLLFGVRQADDPAIAVVKRLQAAFPAADMTLVVDPVLHGANYKVSNLINMIGAAKHDCLVLSDSDMVVRPDYLDAVVGALQRPNVGLATCLYIGRPMRNLWSALGAAGINFGFLPSAAVSKQLGGKTGCYGATLALSRATLDAVGGFAALRDQLADDYALGARVRASGRDVVVAPYFVDTVVDEPDFRALIQHELRWARTIRNTEALGFAASFITYPVPLALLAVLFGLTVGRPWPMLAAILALACVSRLALVAGMVRVLHAPKPSFWLLVPRDVLSLVILVLAFFGRAVRWRDSAFRIDRAGALSAERMEPSP